MTSREIFLQAFSEATGEPKESLTLPPGYDTAEFDRELPPHEAEALLAQLRREMPAIIEWLSKQNLLSKPPKGNA